MGKKICIKQFGLFTLLAFFTSACIEPYWFDVNEETKIITIEGSLIKGNVEQNLVISNTITLLYQEFPPVRGCQAKIVDELDNEFFYSENRDGTYTAKINDDMLVYDREYKLSITTPAGKVYESEFESLNNSAAVDTVYYAVEEEIERYTGELLKGVQFYVDIKAEDTISRYFKWKLTETYEYTSVIPISYLIYDNTWLDPVRPDDIWEVYRCWLTEDAGGLYLTNTMNLTVNEKKRIPLHFVSDHGSELKIKYSVLVEQFTLGESAYNYWQQKKISTGDEGGLYARQPSLPVSNICNIEDDQETVLGYFWASSKSEQRVILPRINSLAVIEDVCLIRPVNLDIDMFGLFPKYIGHDPRTGLEMTGSAFCFDCTLKGGTTTKPDFWE